MKQLINISASLLLAIFSSQIMAQIEVTTVAETEVTETDAGHFLQEEVPEELAEAILEVVSQDHGDN